MMNNRQYLIIVYPYNGGNVYSQKVNCRHSPSRNDIDKLERLFNARVEIINLSAK